MPHVRSADDQPIWANAARAAARVDDVVRYLGWSSEVLDERWVVRAEYAWEGSIAEFPRFHACGLN